VEAVDAGQPLPREQEPVIDAVAGQESPAPEQPVIPEGPQPFAMESPDLLAPEGLQDDFQARQLQKFEQLSPEDQAAEFTDWQVTRQQEMDKARERERQADEAAAAKNDIVLSRARAQFLKDKADIQTEQKRLMSQKEDPDQWMNDLSAGQEIALYLGAAINGFLNPGGDNPTIKMAMHAIDRNIDSQRQNMANQRELLGMRMGAATDDYQMAHSEFLATEAKRQAAYAKLDERMAAEQAKFDPRGSRFFAIAGERQAAAAHAAEAAAKADEQILKRNIAIGEYDMKAEDQAMKRARFQKEMAPKPSGPKYSAADVQKMYPGLVVPDKPGGWTPAEVKALVGVRKDVKDLSGTSPADATKAVEFEQKRLELEQSQRGDVIKDSTGAVLGKPRAKSEEQKAQIRSAVVSYEQFRPKLVELMDLVKDIGEADLTSGRWPEDKETRYNLLRDELGEMYARVKQPVGILTDKPGGDIDRAKEKIPTREGWTRFSKSRNPEAVYKELTALVDDSFDTKVGVELEGFDPAKSPTKRYKAKDAQIFAKEGAVDAEMVKTRNRLLYGSDEPPAPLTTFGEPDAPVPAAPDTLDDPWARARGGK